MAVNLHKAGFKVTATDLSADARARVAAEGVSVSDSAAGAVSDADVVISMLPASRHVEGLYLGEGGLLATLAASVRVIDCSTIAPETARKVAKAAAEKGISLIDAPVSGGTAGATNATLTFMVGVKMQPSQLPSPYSRPWAKTFFTLAAMVLVRSRKSAITCCLPSI